MPREIAQLIDNGYIWIGNYPSNEALNKIEKINNVSQAIDTAICIPARDLDGNPLEDKYSVWIKIYIKKR